MAAELREDPIQRAGWVMGLFLKVNRLDFFVPKERATGFAFVSSVDAIRAPKASSSATRPGQTLGYFYLMQNFPHFPGRDRSFDLQLSVAPRPHGEPPQSGYAFLASTGKSREVHGPISKRRLRARMTFRERRRVVGEWPLRRGLG